MSSQHGGDEPAVGMTSEAKLGFQSQWALLGRASTAHGTGGKVGGWLEGPSLAQVPWRGGRGSMRRTGCKNKKGKNPKEVRGPGITARGPGPWAP